MAWRSIGSDNTDLIHKLKDFGVILSDNVERTMLATDRKFYAPRNPYIDAPQSIGHSVTISAPHMHAFALEYLRDHLKPGAHVLDVGSGSGYLTACFLRYIQFQEEKDGKENSNTLVVGIEHIPDLVKQSEINLKTDDPKLLESNKLIIINGDGRMGYAKHGSYNAIHVGAASPEIPVELINQLAKGGRLIVPIGAQKAEQFMYQIDKDEEGIVKHTKLMNVIYVPLTDHHE